MTVASHGHHKTLQQDGHALAVADAESESEQEHVEAETQRAALQLE